MSVLALPPELLDHICNYVGSFEDECRTKTLLSIMLSSKVLYNAARPELYRILDSPKGSDKFPFERVLRLVTDQPDVVGFVKEIYVRDPGGRSWYGKTKLDVSLTKRLHTIAESVDISEYLKRDLQAGIRVGKHDALICVLLVVCRNLTLLYRETTHSFQQTLMMQFLKEAGTLEGVLDRLHTINTRAINSYIRSSLSGALRCWTIPSLRSYGGENVELINHSPAIDQGTSNLRTLTLTESLIDPSGLERILTLCPELTHLHIEIGDPEITGPSIPYGDLGDVFRCHESRIDFFLFTKSNNYIHVDNFPPRCESALGDLTCMKKLRDLHVDWDALFGSKDSSHAERLSSRPDYLAGSLPHSLELITLWMQDFAPDNHELADAQLVGLMNSDGHKNLRIIMVPDRDRESFTHPIPPGWKISLDEADSDSEDCLTLWR